MASKVTLINLAKVDSTITNDLNTNFTRLADAIDDALDRTGASPNQLEDDVDANDYEIVNLGAPQNNSSAARLRDVLDEQTSITDIDAVSFNSKTYSDLKALKPATLSSGDVRYVRGRTSVGDGGEGHFRWDSSDLSTEVGNDSNEAIYVSPDTDATGASGAWVKQSGAIDKDVTVAIPSTYATLQGAIDNLSKYNALQGVTITLNIESGHQPTSGISVTDGVFNHFEITSDDATVTVGAGAAISDFIYVENASGPVLNCLIDANNECDNGYNLAWTASGFIEQGAGVRNTNEVGLRIYNASEAFARLSDWASSTKYALRCSRGSRVQAQESDFSNCAGTGNTNGCVYINRVSLAQLQQSDFSGCGGEAALYVHRESHCNAFLSTWDDITANYVVKLNRGGKCSINNSTFNRVENAFASVAANGDLNAEDITTLTAATGNSSEGVAVGQAGRVNFQNSVIDGFGSHGINCVGGFVFAGSSAVSNSGGNGLYSQEGGTISARSCAVTGSGSNGAFGRRGGSIVVADGECSGSGSNDLAVTEGSQVFANGTTTTNGTGSPAIADANVSSFNAIDSNNGIIWD